MTDHSDDLGARLARLANPHDDSDWLDVKRRARGLERARRRPARSRIAAVAAVCAAAVLAASPALGLGNPISAVQEGVSNLFGGEPEQNFRYHNGRELSVYVSLSGAGGERRVLEGKVWSNEIASLELALADGRTVQMQIGTDGFFRQSVPAASKPQTLIGRDAGGAIVYRMTLPGDEPHWNSPDMGS